MQKRQALVIGNSDYASLSQLRCCLRDATEVSKALEKLHFSVYKNNINDIPTNLTQTEMDTVITNFINSLDESSIVFFYFSGHGCHNKGNFSFLLPIDYSDLTNLNYNSYWCANKIIRAIEQKVQKGFCIAVFDACRVIVDKGKTVKTISSQPIGTTTIEAEGTIIGYSCEDGEVSYTGKISRYTQCLLKHINRDEDIGYIFRAINYELSKHPHNQGSKPQQARYLDALRAEGKICLHTPPRWNWLLLLSYKLLFFIIVISDLLALLLLIVLYPRTNSVIVIGLGIFMICVFFVSIILLLIKIEKNIAPLKRVSNFIWDRV